MVLFSLLRSYKNQLLIFTSDPPLEQCAQDCSQSRKTICSSNFRLVLNTYIHTSVITQRCRQVFKSWWATCDEVGLISPLFAIWSTELPNSAHPLTTSLSHPGGINYRSSYFCLIYILKRFMSGNILLWPFVKVHIF